MAKSETKIDKKALLACIAAIESNGPVANMNTLAVAVAEKYNLTVKEPYAPISHSVVLLRIHEWEVPIKTQKGKKGRQAVIINATILAASITAAELNGPLTKRSDLYEAVAAKYNDYVNNHNGELDQKYPNVTAAQVYVQIKDGTFTIKTPKGKKGRQKGQPLPAGFGVGRLKGVRTNRSEKFAKDPKIVQCLAALKDYFGTAEPKRIEQIAAGSMKAAIAVKCIDCLGGVKADIRNCSGYKGKPALPCSLFPFRPFQKVTLTKEGVEIEEDNESQQEGMEAA